MERNPWAKIVQDRWFFAALAFGSLAVAWLLLPFGYPLLFAGTTVVVAWPVYERVLAACRGQRALAAVLTTLTLAVAVIAPLGFLLYLFALEAIQVTQMGVLLVTSGDLERQATEIFYEVELTKWRDIPYVDQFLPVDFDPLKAVLGPLQEALLFLLNNVGHALPGVLNTLVTGSIQVSIYVFAVLTLFMEGPKVLDAMRRLSPMDDAYEARLFTVFKEFSNNLVIGSLATAALQGTVASIGYTIAGGPRVLFAGILTGVFSFVPVVGTAVVWVPVALYVAFEHGVGWGIFLAAWSALVTGSVDNIVKPMFLRGSSNIHPLLIFLAVFGGLTWMGLPGALIGPVVVAGFLALYTIYCEDYLGIEAQVAEASGGPGLLDRLKQRLSTRGEEVRAEDLTDADTDETASQSQSQADEVSRD